MSLRYLNDIDLKTKRIVARFDFNVPLKEKCIVDTTRIDLSLESIRYILANGAKLTMIGHLGRPRGEKLPQYSFKPIASYLAEKLELDVILTESCLDTGIKGLLNFPTTKAVLLENVRFHREEEENNRAFAKTLSRYGDIYVNDAFGTCHRKHASTYEINAFFKDRAVGGLLLKREIEALKQITEILGGLLSPLSEGAKVNDKIPVIESLLKTVDTLLIGGAMAYPFLKAKQYDIGTSLCSQNDFLCAQKILSKVSSGQIRLPLDHVISSSLKGTPERTSGMDIREGMRGFDIGFKTLEYFKDVLGKAKTIFWNGPMGLFEENAFSEGTFGIAKALSTLDAFTFVGGGDSISAVRKAKLFDKISHISTGGGASLEYIEKGTLPGIQALKHGIA